MLFFSSANNEHDAEGLNKYPLFQRKQGLGHYYLAETRVTQSEECKTVGLIGLTG